MQTATRLMNLASALVLMVTGIYVMVVFSQMLTLLTLVAVGLLTMTYFVANLIPWLNSERKEIDGVTG